MRGGSSYVSQSILHILHSICQIAHPQVEFIRQKINQLEIQRFLQTVSQSAQSTILPAVGIQQTIQPAVSQK
jgi:hypothetical protein